MVIFTAVSCVSQCVGYFGRLIIIFKKGHNVSRAVSRLVEALDCLEADFGDELGEAGLKLLLISRDRFEHFLLMKFF